MIRSPARLLILPSLAVAVLLASPAYGEAPGSNRPDDGLTRETFVDTNTPSRAPASTPVPRRVRSQRTRLDSKDFLSVHHVARHRGHAKKANQVAAAKPPLKRRNPVVGFVYWWNGWVLKTFHTKVGTVMLGTVGAKS